MCHEQEICGKTAKSMEICQEGISELKQLTIIAIIVARFSPLPPSVTIGRIMAVFATGGFLLGPVAGAPDHIYGHD